MRITTLDVRDLISEFEVLEEEVLEALDEAHEYSDEEISSLAKLQNTSYLSLKNTLQELAGCGGDHQWRGDWYPVTLIHEDSFTEYCEELVKDCGDIPRNLPLFIERNIDWNGVASDMQQDYSSITIDGDTYYYQ